MSRPQYCTKNNGDCNTCNLTNYGLDCANNPVSKKPMPERKKAFEQFAFEQGIWPGAQTMAELHKLRREHKGSRWITIIELFKARGQAQQAVKFAADDSNDLAQYRAILKAVLDRIGAPPATATGSLSNPYAEMHRAEEFLRSHD